MEEHPAHLRIDANDNEVGSCRRVHGCQNCAGNRGSVALAGLESANPVVGACAAQVSKVLEEDDADFPDSACHVPGNPPALYDILPFELELILGRVVNG